MDSTAKQHQHGNPLAPGRTLLKCCSHAGLLLPAGGCNARCPLVRVLEAPPRVFTLHLGWQGQERDPAAISTTLEAVDERVGGRGSAGNARWWRGGAWTGS